MINQDLLTVLAEHLLKTKKKTKKIRKVKETGDSRSNYHNELDEACFQHNMANELLRICLEEQLLTKYDKAFLILLKIQNMMDIDEVLLQWFINVLIKSLQAVTSNQHPLGSACVAKVFGCKQQLAIELHKPVIRKLGKPKVYSSFKDYVSLIFTVNMHRFFL